jgi:signal transduction histidine kinase
VKAGRAHRRYAVRVAAVATLIVMLAYVVAALVLNLIVTNHLVSTADTRLSDRLKDAQNRTLTLPRSTPQGEHQDVDDAPLFVWSVAPGGVATALTPSAPALPVRHWTTAPVTLRVGTSPFRFDTAQAGRSVLVAGQSIAGESNVQSTLLVAELVFGAILAVATFAGATIVGLRASAPSELIRRRQAEFTADASHELRTPISVIEAEVELALDRPRDPAAYRDVLERVSQESTRLRGIVEDLLWLARADNQAVRDDVDDVVDVADIVEAAVQRFGAPAATHRVALAAQRVGGGPFTVQANADLIARLAGVLIDNACKFAGDGGRVEVSVRSAGGRVELRVDDSGPGIPEDQRDAVFDRFHRASDAVAGTGLGLAIADSVVRSTLGSWEIAVSELGGARMGVSWRKALARRGRPTPSGPSGQSGETLTQSLA